MWYQINYREKYKNEKNENALTHPDIIKVGIDKANSRKRFGLIAQDVQQVLKNKNIDDFAGFIDPSINNKNEDRLYLSQTEFIGPIIQSIKDLNTINDDINIKLNNKSVNIDNNNISILKISNIIKNMQQQIVNVNINLEYNKSLINKLNAFA